MVEQENGQAMMDFGSGSCTWQRGAAAHLDGVVSGPSELELALSKVGVTTRRERGDLSGIFFPLAGFSRGRGLSRGVSCRVGLRKGFFTVLPKS